MILPLAPRLPPRFDIFVAATVAVARVFFADLEEIAAGRLPSASEGADDKPEETELALKGRTSRWASLEVAAAVAAARVTVLPRVATGILSLSELSWENSWGSEEVGDESGC